MPQEVPLQNNNNPPIPPLCPGAARIRIRRAVLLPSESPGGQPCNVFIQESDALLSGAMAPCRAWVVPPPPTPEPELPHTGVFVPLMITGGQLTR